MMIIWQVVEDLNPARQDLESRLCPEHPTYGSKSRDRTYDHPVNSRTLFR